MANKNPKSDLESRATGEEDGEEGLSNASAQPKKKWYSWLIENWFMIATIIGVIIGFGAGFGIQTVGLSADAEIWLGKPFL